MNYSRNKPLWAEIAEMIIGFIYMMAPLIDRWRREREERRKADEAERRSAEEAVIDVDVDVAQEKNP